jgi:hypothetical protein
MVERMKMDMDENSEDNITKHCPKTREDWTPDGRHFGFIAEEFCKIDKNFVASLGAISKLSPSVGFSMVGCTVFKNC